MAPLRIEHVLPLCTATATLSLNLLHYPVFISFLTARPSIAGRPLSNFWTAFFYQAVGFIITPLTLSASTGFLARRSLSSNPVAASWYGYGALCALAHFLFVPAVAGPMAEMRAGSEQSRIHDAVDKPVDYVADQRVEENNRVQQGRWLRWHTVRTVLVDIPAVWCFAKGLCNAVEVV